MKITMNSHSAPRNHYPVAIIGYGPVGATLANLLGQAGIDSVIIDREASYYHLPRAVHFDDEVMRVFQTIGLADSIAPTLRVNLGMRFVDSNGKLLLDWPRPQEISQHGWHASYRFHQPALEKILRHGLTRFDCVDVLTHTEVTAVHDTQHQVELDCRERASGKAFRLTADYVVGCDGANSLVRKSMGTGFDDFGFNQRWLVLDVLLKQDKPSLGDHSIQYCNPERPATYARSPGNRRRWEVSLTAEESSEQVLQTDYIWQLVQAWISPAEADIERAAVYTFNSKVVQDWRKNRLMIAGDAAHLTPPFMGQGMCAGIRDVSNLGWKLIAVVRGEARDSLLDTYGSERYANAAEYVKTAVRLGGLVNTAGTGEALLAALKPASQQSAAKMESIAPPLGPGIAAGNPQYRGQLFAQPRLLDGRRSDDVYGYRAVLHINKTAFSTAALQQAENSGVVMLDTEQSLDLAEHLNKRGVAAILARSDRYIVGSANNDAELIELCGWDDGFAVKA